jgi:hypothetical protein
MIDLWPEEKPEKSRQQRKYEFIKECFEGYRRFLEDRRNGVAGDLNS